MISTLEELFEYMAEKINAASGPMHEGQRALLVADAVYEAAMFVLSATPCNAHHQLALTAELIRRLRNFHSPFLLLAREMGDDEQLRKAFEHFLSSTGSTKH